MMLSGELGRGRRVERLGVKSLAEAPAPSPAAVQKAAGLALVLTVAVATMFGAKVRADAAPPWYAQGASVETSESMTNVQMVSESVLLVVERQDAAPEGVGPGLAATSMIGRVEATFVMQNQGTEVESFDVWFPIGTYDGYGRRTSLSGFAAWVNEVPAELGERQVPDKSDRPKYWVTWPAAFPPGEEVTLRVVYDVLPVGYDPIGTFHYVLETGAGWRGPIGEGTITFRLPYEVNESNTVLAPRPWSDLTRECSNPATSTISGTDVTWRFADLEPTREDNVCLTMVVPAAWERIEAAQQEVATNPGSPEAHVELARALVSTVHFGPGAWWPTGHLDTTSGRDIAVAEAAVAAYGQAVRLGMEDVDVYAEYIELLGAVWIARGDFCSQPVPEALLAALGCAWELAPGDQRLVAIKTGLDEIAAYCDHPTTTLYPTLAPTPAPTWPSVNASPVAATSPAQTATSVSPTLTPSRTPSRDGGGLCLGAPAGALVLVIGLVVAGKGGRRAGAGERPLSSRGGRYRARTDRGFSLGQPGLSVLPRCSSTDTPFSDIAPSAVQSEHGQGNKKNRQSKGDLES